jgi:hypothetical protein
MSTSAAAAPAASGDTAARTAYRACLAQHGATLATGTANKGAGTGSPADQAARQACASLRPAGGFGGNRGAIGATVLAAFRSCMSGHGVMIPTAAASATPTSSSTGTGRRGGVLGGLNRNDPKVKAALAVCQKLLPSRGPSPSSS